MGTTLVKKFKADFDTVARLTHFQQASVLAHFHGALSYLMTLSRTELTDEAIVAAFSRAVNYAKPSRK